MKKISVVLFSVIMALSASAQRAVVVRPAMHVGAGMGYYPRPYFYSPYHYGFNSWYGRPAYYYRNPTKLERQIQDIENEYRDRIKSVRADDSLSHHDRRQKIRVLRDERRQTVDDATKNYYKKFEK